MESPWLNGCVSAASATLRIPYAVRDKSDGSIAGTTSFLNIKPEWQTVEIGGTFLIPRVRSGYVNPESKGLDWPAVRARLHERLRGDYPQ